MATDLREIVFLTTLTLRMRRLEVREEGCRGGRRSSPKATRIAEESALTKKPPPLGRSCTKCVWIAASVQTGRRALTDRPDQVCDPYPGGAFLFACKRKARGPLLAPLARNVCVDLRGRKITMPEQHLHHTQISAVIQQVGGECVPQGVR